ncbi:MAG: hypothetical protein MHMPM18_003889 [Marteilia pararefringens]
MHRFSTNPYSSERIRFLAKRLWVSEAIFSMNKRNVSSANCCEIDPKFALHPNKRHLVMSQESFDPLDSVKNDHCTQNSIQSYLDLTRHQTGSAKCPHPDYNEMQNEFPGRP